MNRMILTLCALGLAWAPAALAEEPVMAEIRIAIEDMQTKRVVGELEHGGVLELEPGDRVRLRLVAVPQNERRGNHYPSGRFELHNAHGMVAIQQVQVDRGSAVFEALRTDRRGDGADPFVRFEVTERLRIDERQLKGAFSIRVTAPPQQVPPPPIAAPPQRPEARRGVTLYEDVDFRGKSATFFEDDPQLADNFPLRQDSASSIRVDDGCEVTLFEHENYRGEATVLDNDESDLGRTRVGSDKVSSLQVDCRGRGDAGPRGVTLYEHADFRGRSETFTGDDRQLSDNPIRQDSASSIKVDRGCEATLYEDENFRGRATVLTDDVADLSGSRVGNDSVSSLEVRCRGRRTY